MTLDPADLVTEIDTAIDAVPGAATPSRSSLAQDIVEALWAAVIDHFVDRPFAGSDPGLVPSSDGSTSKFLRGDGTFAAPSGGDGWTYVVLTSEFDTTSATAVTVTGLTFTPAASATYLVEGLLILGTTTDANIAPQPGISWPSGLSGHGGGRLVNASSSAGNVNINGTQGTNFVANNASFPALDAGYVCEVRAVFTTGGSPSGDFEITLESEAGLTNHVVARVGSHIRYRKIIG